MTTPAQPSKTPITDEIREVSRQGTAIVLEHQEAGWEQLAQLLADFVAAREGRLRDVIMDCERQVAELRAQVEADRREIERLKAYLRGTEASHVEACFKLAEEFGDSKFSSEPPLEFVRKQLTTAQQRIKELEADKSRLDWLETRPILPIDCSVRPGIEPEFERSGITRASIDSAMSREPKEGEAK